MYCLSCLDLKKNGSTSFSEPVPQVNNQQVNSGIAIPALELKVTDPQVLVRVEEVSKWEIESGDIIQKNITTAVLQFTWYDSLVILCRSRS